MPTPYTDEQENGGLRRVASQAPGMFFFVILFTNYVYRYYDYCHRQYRHPGVQKGSKRRFIPSFGPQVSIFLGIFLVCICCHHHLNIFQTTSTVSQCLPWYVTGRLRVVAKSQHLYIACILLLVVQQYQYVTNKILLSLYFILN